MSLDLRVPCAEVAVAGINDLLQNILFLDLDRCVVDVKSLAGDTVDAREKIGPAEVVLGDDMAAHRENSGRQRPNMKVMHGVDSIDASKLFSQTAAVYMR